MATNNYLQSAKKLYNQGRFSEAMLIFKMRTWFICFFKMRRIFVVLLPLFISVISFADNRNQTQYAKVVNVSSYLNIREAATQRSSIIGKLEKDEYVTVWPSTRTSDNWIKIQKDNTIGYVKASYLQITTATSQEADATESSNSHIWYFILIVIALVVIYYLLKIAELDNISDFFFSFLIRCALIIAALIVVRLIMIFPNFWHWLNGETWFGVFDLEGNLMTTEHFGSFIMTIYLFLNPIGWSYLFAGIFGMCTACFDLEKKWHKIIVASIFGVILLGTYDKDYMALMPSVLSDICQYLHDSLGFAIRASADESNYIAFDLSVLAGFILCVFM